MEFTQEIKDGWLADLKSGNYKQGFGLLYNSDDDSYCCYGVLGKRIGDDLSYAVTGQAYDMVKDVVGEDGANELWDTNDKQREDESYPRDYSNVIPLIEQLPVKQ